MGGTHYEKPTDEDSDTPLQLVSLKVLKDFVSSIDFASFGARSGTALQGVQRLNPSPPLIRNTTSALELHGNYLLTQIIGFIVSAVSLGPVT